MTMRRLVDVAVAAAALVVLSPALVAVAIAVRLGSPGPVLFRQRRAGLDGRPFMLLKFRTMRDGAGGPGITSAGDARVTPVGVWLRRWKLDELPQLVNVLRGEMTLLGPRPEIPELLACLGPLGREYAAVTPGLADAATLTFLDEAELLAGATDPERRYVETILPEKARQSVAYARRRTFGSDARLLWALARRVAGVPPKPSWSEFHAESSRSLDR